VLVWQNIECYDVLAAAKLGDTRNTYRMWRELLGKHPPGNKNRWGVNI